MKRGWIWGLGAGWIAGVALASLTTEPAGMSMVTLGLAGAGAGLFVQVAGLRVWWLDALLLLGMMVAEDALAASLARMVYGAPLRFGFLGCAATALVVLPLFLLIPLADRFAHEAARRDTVVRRRSAEPSA